jgi:hypothetical protein
MATLRVIIYSLFLPFYPYFTDQGNTKRNTQNHFNTSQHSFYGFRVKWVKRLLVIEDKVNL